MHFKQYKSSKHAIQSLKSDHFDCEFEFKKGRLHCEEKNKVYEPSQLYLVEYHRFEKEDEVLIVYAFLCNDGNKGLLQCSFGSEIDMRIITFLDKVKILTNETI